MRHSLLSYVLTSFLGLIFLTPMAEGGKEFPFPVPVYPKATDIVSASGSGRGFRWYRISFVTGDPYKQVVEFYRKEAGKRAAVSWSTSEEIEGTLILLSKTLKDQTQINISHRIGSPKTEVVILRQLLD